MWKSPNFLLVGWRDSEPLEEWGYWGLRKWEISPIFHLLSSSSLPPLSCLYTFYHTSPPHPPHFPNISNISRSSLSELVSWVRMLVGVKVSLHSMGAAALADADTCKGSATDNTKGL